MKPAFILFTVLTAASLNFSCNNEAGHNEKVSEQKGDSLSSITGQDIREDEVTYTSGSTNLKGYVYYNAADSAKRPIVLVTPEWWGLTEYPKMRARQLAGMGYLAMAIDIYGEGKTVEDPDAAGKAATPFYQAPQEGKARIDAALAKARTYAQADTSRTAAIGYCFGGSMVLNAAKLGSDFDGVVSFHGGLEGVPPSKDLLKARIFVAHGGADSFVPQSQVTAFRKSLDSIGASYSFKTYPNATHAFTNPDADKKAEKFKMPIKYNGAADTASWADMKGFLQTVFQ